jgi:hypothetical protein
MNKKILIGIGVIALVGGIYYFTKKKNDIRTKSSEVLPSETTEETATTPPTPEVSTEAPIVATASKKEARKQSRSDKKTFQGDCGTRPSLRKNRPAWQKCVDEQKLKQGSSFEGTNSMDLFSDISGGFENMDIL